MMLTRFYFLKSIKTNVHTNYIPLITFEYRYRLSNWLERKKYYFIDVLYPTHVLEIIAIT